MHKNCFMPREWQNRIRTIPSLKDRATLAVFVINAYKRRKAISRTPSNLSSWKIDRHLGQLAFWPTHARATLFHFHTYFLCNDVVYFQMNKGLQRERVGNTFGPTPIIHTFPSPNKSQIGA